MKRHRLFRKNYCECSNALTFLHPVVGDLDKHSAPILELSFHFWYELTTSYFIEATGKGIANIKGSGTIALHQKAEEMPDLQVTFVMQ
ncbi:hypothetical protein KTT_49760 [Tengunoibacter tsumagoiensis]|uniref:Uncharacterized protein n=1 Tax=Tengunoibacter tsumagoiensis TaxID=2014871 RepID=A0A402A7I5_9CHLR|nr:hypothetical protein KTT_49760 [Tengunoibacter tsumagoiensis]